MNRKRIAILMSIGILLLTAVNCVYAAPASLKQGMEGEGVRMLQEKLTEYGYYSGDLDGKFGSGTRLAVTQFQLDCGLDVDGVAGAQTWQALHDFRSMNVNRGVSRQGTRVVAFARSFLGVPYVWAGTSPGGFDCSGFVSYIYRQFGINLPRMADEQFEVGMPISSRRDLQSGDLVFFTTYEPGASHVGIYIGNDMFIHASSGAGEVTITSLSQSYYRARYLGARRVMR